MTTIDTRPFRDVDNLDIMNAIRNASSTDYQRRVPSATKANVDSTIEQILSYRPNTNEFVDNLVNLIGLQIVKSTLWTNPLAKYKRGMLMFGDTIEEINVGLLEAKRYDPDREYLEKDLFGQERADVQSSFHKINRQDYYKISVNNTLLRRAFSADFGLSKFVASLMSAPTTSDQWDEFLLTTSLFKIYNEAGGFFNVNVPDISSSSSTADDAKNMLRRVREYSDNLTFINTAYNASGMPVAASRDELELFVTPGANAAMDVEALAAAFNIERAEVGSRTTVIPDQYFGIDGAQAILTTRDFFVIADSLIDTANVVNPVGLHTNYFLHHHQVISASRFVPALLFTTKPGDVITLTDYIVTGLSAITVKDGSDATVTSVERGGMYVVEASAVTTPVGGDNDAVMFSITGNNSPRTRITQTGMLHVDYAETAFELVVNVSPVDSTDATLDGTVTLGITGDLLNLWPDPSVTLDADNDGLLEVTPIEPDFTTNVITIPSVTGVQYQNGGVSVNNGTKITVVDGTPVTITAIARANYELTAGVTASWTFTYVA